MNLKSTLIGLSLVAASALFPLAHAQTAAPAASAAMQPGAAMTEGEVKKVDKENKKITLKHGEIKNLEMPGMTMVFQVKDPAMLDTFKPGTKVLFRAEKIGAALVVTEMQSAQ